MPARTIKFDYTKLSAIQDDDSRPWELFYLSPAAVAALSQMRDMLLWYETRWTNYDDQEIVIDFASDLHDQMSAPLHLEDLIEFIDELEPKMDLILAALDVLKNVSGCCPDNTTVFPPDGIGNPDGYSYFDGPFPDTWGDGESVGDLADYQDLLCGAAHHYVDYLAGIGAQIDSMVSNAALGVAVVAAALGILSGAGILIDVAFAVAAGGTTDILANWITDLLGDASDAIEAIRDEVVCAIFSGDGQNVADTIESEISSLAWQTFFRWIDYQSAINVMLTGEYQGEYLPVERGLECDCLPPGEDTTYHFFTSGGSVIDLLNGGANVHNTAIYTYHVYRLSGNHASVETFNLNFNNGSETRVPLDMHITAVQYRTGFGGTQVVQLYDETLGTMVAHIDKADIPYSGDVDGIGRVNHLATKDTYSPDVGYIEFYVTLPA